MFHRLAQFGLGLPVDWLVVKKVAMGLGVSKFAFKQDLVS